MRDEGRVEGSGSEVEGRGNEVGIERGFGGGVCIE